MHPWLGGGGGGGGGRGRLSASTVPKKEKEKKNAPEWIAYKSPQSVIQLSVCRWARCVGGGGDGGGPALVSRVMSNSQRVSCFCFCFVFVFFKMLQSPPLGGAIPSAASPAEADTLEERERERDRTDQRRVCLEERLDRTNTSCRSVGRLALSPLDM